MREHARLGAVEVARRLGRSVSSVRSMAKRQRISLRSSGERRGLILGQPRGTSVSEQLRSDVVSGRVDAELLARRMALVQAAETCPCCGRRPIEVHTTGFCLVCHKDRLSSAHLDEVEKLDAQRALWSSRQALCRARKAAGT
jgi:hypothetical protein